MINVVRSEGDKYCSIEITVSPEQMRPFVDSISSFYIPVSGRLSICCSASKINANDKMFYLYYYDDEAQEYLNRVDCPVTPELMDLFKSYVKEGGEK